MTLHSNSNKTAARKPFEPTADFVKVHRALYSLYTRLPEFKADHALMYIVLMDYYNAEYGYAYPTKATLALRLNCGINKPSQLANVLEDCGLIKCVERDRSKVGSNDVYYVYAPITDEHEFNVKFPEAAKHYEEQERKMLSRNKRKVTQKKEESEPIEDADEDASFQRFIDII